MLTFEKYLTTTILVLQNKNIPIEIIEIITNKLTAPASNKHVTQPLNGCVSCVNQEYIQTLQILFGTQLNKKGYYTIMSNSINWYQY